MELTHTQSEGSSTTGASVTSTGAGVAGTAGASVGSTGLGVGSIGASVAATGLGVGAIGAAVAATGLGVSGKMPKGASVSVEVVIDAGAGVSKSVGEPVGLLVENISSHVMQMSCYYKRYAGRSFDWERGGVVGVSCESVQELSGVERWFISSSGSR